MTSREKSALKERIDYYSRMADRFLDSDDLGDIRKSIRYFSKANALREFYTAVESGFFFDDFCEDIGEEEA